LVLLVSGDPSIVGMGGLVFRALGYRISIARGAEEAVALLTEDLPAVVLCEVDLPGLGGVELTRLIRTTAGGEQTVVILIGDGDEPAGNAADGYLRQPFDPMKAIELVEALDSA
jgi:two-component system, chemotaxis family, chemotaxis protein CheY